MMKELRERVAYELSINKSYSYYDDIYYLSPINIDADRITRLYAEYMFYFNTDKTKYFKHPIEFIEFI